MTKDDTLQLTRENFVAVRDLVRNRIGVFLADSKYSFLSLRLAYRLQLLNIASVDDYLYFIKYNPRGQRELQELIEAIVINETFFFREQEHFQALAHMVLPKSTPLRIWSCGCSTGEEAYSLAATAAESLPNERLRRIDILGTDISNKVLESARRGTYTEQALREVSLRRLRRYFEKTDTEDSYRVKKGLRELVTFGRLNVIDAAGVAKIGTFDVIFCRNLLMYMDDHSRHKAFVNIYQALKSDGWLFLGKSEGALGAASLFDIGHWGSIIYYRKPVIEQRAAG